MSKTDERKKPQIVDVEAMLRRIEWLQTLGPGDPCDHPGCLHHVSHPCEGCGRIAGRKPTEADR